MANKGLDELLDSFKSEAKELLGESVKFNSAVDNILAISGDFNFALLQHNGPFFPVVRAIEQDMRRLIEFINFYKGDNQDGAIERLYRLTEPLFRARTGSDDPNDRPSFGDPISAYQQFASHLLSVYENGEKRHLSNLYQDFFLKEVLRKSLIGLPVFSEKPYKQIGEGARRMGRYVLRQLQFLYSSDPLPLLERYMNLLGDIERKLRGKVKIPEFEGMHKRKVFDLETSEDVSVKTDLRYVETKKRGMEDMLVPRIAHASEWGRYLQGVADYIYAVHRLKEPDIFDKYNFLCYQGRGKFAKTEIGEVKRRDILGFSEKVDAVYKLLTSFVEGNRIPVIGLIGKEGVGKTMTLRYCTHSIKGLKIVEITSDQLDSIDEITEAVSEKPYRTLICVRDLRFDDPRFDRWQGIWKEVTSGMKDLPDNIAIAVLSNPEVIRRLETAAGARIGFKIDYEYSDSNRPLVRRIFRKYCRDFGVDYSAHLLKSMYSQYSKEEREVTPRAIKDYVLAQSALLNSKRRV